MQLLFYAGLRVPEKSGCYNGRAKCMYVYCFGKKGMCVSESVREKDRESAYANGAIERAQTVSHDFGPVGGARLQ